MERQFAMTAAGLAELIDALEPLATKLLEAAGKQERPSFIELYRHHEAYTQQLLRRLEAGERQHLTDRQRETLQRVLALREQIQQRIAGWAEQVKGELRALSQSSKLNREYK
ncbi:flagellar protein FliT [Chromobacterium sp. CV08]|uniref:flagellar protein FliT n=1 Tax=Chromobacterium sp. CV08 TaxID=3133274 RepID=UPI003DA9FEDB